MNDETRDAVKRIFDEMESERRERMRHLEAKVRDCPGSLTDRDRLELVVGNPEIESVPHFEMLVTSLSFAKETVDPESVKTAWKEFLTSCESPTLSEEWDLASDRVMTRCFERLGKTDHSIAVYEHILSEIIGGDPNYRDGAEECLFRLFEYYTNSTSTRRAREILTLIRTFNENGLVSDARYYEVLPQETELFCRELGQAVDQDRRLAEERLRLENGGAFENLHPMTKGYIIDAELWSDDRMRKLDPSAGPRRWALGIEAEFHYKVYEPYRKELASALGRSPKTCGPRDIIDLLKLSSSSRVAGQVISQVFRRLSGHETLASLSNLDALEVICEHRNQIAHATTLGPYTLNRCNAFLETIRESGWLYTFLSALQPIRPE
ncbi:MAG TPA: hypothetical protein VLA99_16095 [Nitrospiraceae bacterium]|nr:hypothetical protein [Nitrospiraceae bacterium]